MKRKSDPTEQILNLRLLEAGENLETANKSQAQREKLLIELAQVISDLPYEPLKSAFVQVANSLANLRLSSKAVVALAPLTKKESSWEWNDIQREIARLLITTAPHDQTARFICQILLESEDFEAREYAALALARSSSRQSRVWRLLVNSQLSEVREFLPDAPEFVLDVILPWLRHESVDYHVDALDLAQAMKRLKQWRGRLVEALLPQLQAKSYYVRFSALKMLVRLKYDDDQIVPLLAQFITKSPIDKKDEDYWMLTSLFQMEATEGLIKMAKKNSRVQQMATQWLSSPDAKIRYSGARILMEIGAENAKTAKIMKESLKMINDSEENEMSDEDDFSLPYDDAPSEVFLDYRVPSDESIEDSISELVLVPVTEERIVKALLRFTGANEESVLPVCRKVLEKQSLTEDDCLIFHNLVRWRHEYEDAAIARHRLFDWFFLTCGPQNVSR